MACSSRALLGIRERHFDGAARPPIRRGTRVHTRQADRWPPTSPLGTAPSLTWTRSSSWPPQTALDPAAAYIFPNSRMPRPGLRPRPGAPRAVTIPPTSIEARAASGTTSPARRPPVRGRTSCRRPVYLTTWVDGGPNPVSARARSTRGTVTVPRFVWRRASLASLLVAQSSFVRNRGLDKSRSRGDHR